ncbi:RNA polymerase sigma factor [Cytophagales bacterium LB-30]|uniref:RNA polymerase sigma factor n=1 Tax=Shiella aurantiaca TaxID=3058365 RepID=A0ABT8F411_9BACT|nr:RNA polymerase sigma factor [Shiella aurantiaca]MDN4165109.1 RNA polymerase sigma factor [Shiella aurantiaca]
MEAKELHPEFRALAQGLLKGHKAGFERLYTDKRGEFIRWLYKEFGMAEEEAVDIYQAAFVILYENIMQGKTNTVSSSPATYVFGIGKNLALKKFKSNERHLNHQQRIQWYLEEEGVADPEVPDNTKQVAQALEQLKEPCKSLLSLFYYDNLSIEQISQRLQYKNKEVVKSQKVRCLAYLKEKLVSIQMP